MKTRNGFVSNSSSSSFVVIGISKCYYGGNEENMEIFKMLGYTDEKLKERFGTTGHDKEGLQEFLSNKGLSDDRVHQFSNMNKEEIFDALLAVGYDPEFLTNVTEFYAGKPANEDDVMDMMYELCEDNPKGLDVTIDNEGEYAYIGHGIGSMESVVNFSQKDLDKLAEDLGVPKEQISFISETIYN